MRKLVLSTALGLALVAQGATAAVAEQSPESKILAHQPVGADITGSDSMDSAPRLEAGAHQDRLPVTGEEQARYYKLPDIQDGERLTVSGQPIVDMMGEPTSRESMRLRAELLDSQGRACAGNSNASISRSNSTPLPVLHLQTTAKDTYSTCFSNEDDTVYLKLQRTGQWQAQDEVPVELRVSVEPAVDPTSLSGVMPEQQPPVSVTLSGEPSPVSGGSGFATATELSAGTISADSVLPYEVKYYKVHLSEGQRLSYRLSVQPSENASASGLATGTYSPLLAPDVAGTSWDKLSREDVGASVTRSTLSEVSRDLVDGYGGRFGLRVPGDYYIAVAGTANDPRGLNPLNYSLAVEVSGEAKNTGAWEPDIGEQGQALAAGDAGSSSWLPSGAQLGAFLGGAAVALAGFAGLWLLRRKRA